jgi:hypothetical protein
MAGHTSGKTAGRRGGRVGRSGSIEAAVKEARKREARSTEPSMGTVQSVSEGYGGHAPGGGWQQGWTEQGMPYYYNSDFAISQWEKPAGWDAPIHSQHTGSSDPQTAAFQAQGVGMTDGDRMRNRSSWEAATSPQHLQQHSWVQPGGYAMQQAQSGNLMQQDQGYELHQVQLGHGMHPWYAAQRVEKMQTGTDAPPWYQQYLQPQPQRHQ